MSLDGNNLEEKCKYLPICQFGKNVIGHPEDCVFYKIYQIRELELSFKEGIGIITDSERDYLGELSCLC